MISIAACVVLLVSVAMIVVLVRKQQRRTAEMLADATSIVMLRERSLELSAADVRGAYRRAYGREPALSVVASPDCLMVSFWTTSPGLPVVRIVSSRTPYLDELGVIEAVTRSASMEVREALIGHRAWVSVDAMGIMRAPAPVRADAILLLGILAAEFYDQGCTLLYRTDRGGVALPGDGVEPALRSGSVDQLFGDDEANAPLLHARADDPEVNAAEAEARRRLPEFIRAFEMRGERGVDQLFKASFPKDRGGNEIMWLKLRRIVDDQLEGEVISTPIAPNVPRRGEVVRVGKDRVVDWLMLDKSGKFQGRFVDSILERRYRDARSR